MLQSTLDLLPLTNQIQAFPYNVFFVVNALAVRAGHRFTFAFKVPLFLYTYLFPSLPVFCLSVLSYFVIEYNGDVSMLKTTLHQYDNTWYRPGRSALVRLLWYFVNSLFFQSSLFPINSLKIGLLRAFGARIGRGVTIKPAVNIKYPWRLSIGSHVWIGERVWIDNLADVHIGSHVCLSQGAMLLTGSHDYKRPTFDLITKDIVLESGVWIGAKAIVCPGVTAGSHSVLSVGSVATTTMEPYTIYQGNPASAKKRRALGDSLSFSPDASEGAYVEEVPYARSLTRL